MKTSTMPLAERLAAVRNFSRNHQRLPSSRELISLFGLSSPRSATYHYALFEKAGYVRKSGRGYVATPRLTALRYFESIAAGFPSPVEGSGGEMMEIEGYLVDHPDRSILVRVTGDSMKDAGIFDGDIVVVELRCDAQHGEIVIALVDGAWTMKFLHRKGGQVILRAANAKYPDIKPEDALSIEGVVRGVIRKIVS